MKTFLIILFTGLGILYIVFSFIQVFKEKKERKAIKDKLEEMHEEEKEDNDHVS